MQRHFARLSRRHNLNLATLPQYTFQTRSRLSRPFAIMSAAAEPDAAAAKAMTATSSGITPESLKATLTEKLEAEYVDVEDISGGCGQSFEAKIVSPLFNQKTSLARHRLVNAALKSEIAAIHAWTPKCFTPGEWEKKKSTGISEERS